jgi:polyisoprenoid-binding protein YceI
MTRYNIDGSHSTAEFSVRHLMITNVRGRFGTLSGTVDFDATNPASSKVNVTIDATSIDTRDAKRDAHLKSADFFETDKYPTITFISTKVEKSGAGYTCTGELTMHGVTGPVTLEVDGPSAEQKDPWGNQRAGASATAKLNRKDWGLHWNGALEAGGVLVGEQVKLEIEISMIAAAA